MGFYGFIWKFYLNLWIRSTNQWEVFTTIGQKICLCSSAKNCAYNTSRINKQSNTLVTNTIQNVISPMTKKPSTTSKKAKTDNKEEHSEVLKNQVHYMGFGWRMLAQVIDLIIMGILFSPIVPLFNSFYYTPKMLEIMQSPTAKLDLTPSQVIDIMLPSSLFQLGLLATYCLVFWLLWSATPGKRIFSMHIVDAKTFKKPTAFQFVLRLIGYGVSLLPLGLGFLSVHFSSRKQGLHDYIAGTVVVEKHKKNKTKTQ